VPAGDATACGIAADGLCRGSFQASRMPDPDWRNPARRGFEISAAPEESGHRTAATKTGMVATELWPVACHLCRMPRLLRRYKATPQIMDQVCKAVLLQR
jgi:hypothetical protein